ncbi:MAG TPA: hypothetical protein VF790_09310 [Dissulfurispiraceae bacterium]
MNAHFVIADWRVVLALQMTLMMLFLSPGISLGLWRTLSRKWARRSSGALAKKRRRAEEKLKRYWEIDMRKFK